MKSGKASFITALLIYAECPYLSFSNVAISRESLFIYFSPLKKIFHTYQTIGIKQYVQWKLSCYHIMVENFNMEMKVKVMVPTVTDIYVVSSY